MRRSLVVVILAGGASGQAIDPRGVFFHDYSAPSFSGIEWVTIVDQPGDRRYEFSDIRALEPFSGTIAEDGQTTWDTGRVSGTGSFSDADRASFQLLFGASTFQSDLWRAPGTSPEFITLIETPEPGRSELAGAFEVTITSLDPRTGATLGARTEMMTLGVSGQTLRLTEGDGDFIQGVFESADAVGFRVVSPAALRPEYRSFVGSETNLGQNLMGDLRFLSDDAFEATVLLQTRTAPGNQSQMVEHYSAVRVPTPGSGAALALGLLAPRGRRRVSRPG